MRVVCRILCLPVRASYKPDSVYFKEVFAGQSASLGCRLPAAGQSAREVFPGQSGKTCFCLRTCPCFQGIRGWPGGGQDAGKGVAVKIDSRMAGLNYCDLQGWLMPGAGVGK
jgi:hypothetical protein